MRNEDYSIMQVKRAVNMKNRCVHCGKKQKDGHSMLCIITLRKSKENWTWNK